MALSFDLMTFDFGGQPPSQAPEWADRVDRWYQLDPPALALAEAYWRHRSNLTHRPECLLLASPGASNFTDHQFVSAPTPSPAKFVHTLPNIRSAPLLRLMDWSGPVFCLQKDPRTISSALSEAHWMVRALGNTWIAGVIPNPIGFKAYLICLNEAARSEFQLNLSSSYAKLPPTDEEWLQWMSSNRANFLAQGLEIIKK